jgi:outer membrane protein assembly factor BamD
MMFCLGFVRKFVPAAVLVGAVMLSGCSWFENSKLPFSDSGNEPAYEERPIYQIYSDAWRKLRNDDWEEAAKQFAEVERQHPYSVWARRASLMSAFCYYEASKYTEAISAAEQYISLHPGSKDVGYAFYLKAISYYEQIVDVERDQSKTETALVALQDVVQRFPDSEYARDATLKIDLTYDHLAGKEMEIGRYYMHNGDYIGAINRFRVVVEQYQRTPQIAEALERLTESYYTLGIVREAQTAAAVLGTNYPGSPWYKDAYDLLKGHKLKPVEDKSSWISKALGLKSDSPPANQP